MEKRLLHKLDLNLLKVLRVLSEETNHGGGATVAYDSTCGEPGIISLT